jgi:hypothetical protein
MRKANLIKLNNHLKRKRKEKKINEIPKARKLKLKMRHCC